MATDQELLARVADRDERALAELYGNYYPRLGRFLLRVTSDVELAVEVINDVFLVVWESASGFRGDSSVSSWILGIAYRKALKAVKRSGRRAEVALPPDLAAREDAGLRDMELASCFGRLSAEQRAVMELTYFFGYSYREIGEILGCPENTVKTRMFHARRALLSILEV